MDMDLKHRFLEKYAAYFPGCELPLVCYYADELRDAEFPAPPKENPRGYTCFFSQLAPVRRGKIRAFNPENLGCPGAAETLGFPKPQTPQALDEMVEFLTQVEKFKKDRERVLAFFQSNPALPPTDKKYFIVKRWDCLTPEDELLAVSFFVPADALAGLHTLANFDTMDPHGVISPFGSGCDSLFGFALKEYNACTHRAVLGLFDPPARGCVKKDLLNFSVTWPRLATLVDHMDQCFLNTYIWDGIRKRMAPEK